MKLAICATNLWLGETFFARNIFESPATFVAIPLFID